jgi:mannose-1-phosphate guanylyltransferase
MVDYKDLEFKFKIQTAKYVYKHLKKKGFNASAPMSVWTNRIKNLIIERQDKFKIEIDWKWNEISSWRSIFDIMLKNLHLIVVHETQPITYSLL